MTALPIPHRLSGPLANTRTGRQLALWPFINNPAALRPQLAAMLIGGAGARGTLPTAAALGRITGWERTSWSGLPPLYAINGAFDRIAPLNDLKRFPLPLERAVIVHTGHMVMLEAPQRLIEELSRIIQDTWDGQRHRAR